MGQPIARLGDKCVSPAGVSGTITTASTDFFSDGRGVARVGDTVTYVNGTTTTCAQGDPFVSDGLRPIVRLGYTLADGGKVVAGSPRATSGSPTPGAGSVAERTLVAARLTRRAFVPVNCEQRLAEPEVAEEPPHASDAPGDGTELHSDRADGGSERLYVDAAGTTPGAAPGAASGAESA